MLEVKVEELNKELAVAKKRIIELERNQETIFPHSKFVHSLRKFPIKLILVF